MFRIPMLPMWICTLLVNIALFSYFYFVYLATHFSFVLDSVTQLTVFVWFQKYRCQWWWQNPDIQIYVVKLFVVHFRVFFTFCHLSLFGFCCRLKSGSDFTSLNHYLNYYFNSLTSYYRLIAVALCIFIFFSFYIYLYPKSTLVAKGDTGHTSHIQLYKCCTMLKVHCDISHYNMLFPFTCYLRCERFAYCRNASSCIMI